MRRFLSDNHGDVNQKIILLAVIVTIALFFFPKTKDSVRCAQEKSDSGIAIILEGKDPKFSEKCKIEGSPANGENGNNGDNGSGGENGGDNENGNNGGDGTDTGDGGNNGGGDTGTGGDNGDGGDSGNGGGTDVEGEYVPISYYDSSGVDLQCTDSQSLYKFTIPSQATPQSTGTKTLSITNRKGWDMWIKITDIKTKNGLSILSAPDKFLALPNEMKASFDIQWRWDVATDYKGDIGEATVYFKTVCDEPADTEVFMPLPEKPMNFIVTSTTANSISLKWDEAKYATSYQLYNRGVLVYEGPLTNATNINLPNGTMNFYSLFAVNKKGKSAVATASGQTSGTSPRPTAPTNFKAINITNNGATLVWDKVSTANSYIVEGDGKTAYSGTGTTTNVTNLTPGTTYTFLLRANNMYGVSAPTTVTFTTTGVSPYPKEPSNFQIIKVTDTTMTLNWDSVPNATSYTLQKNGTTVYTGNGTNYTVTGLTPGTYYYFYLYANNSNGSSDSAYTSGTTTGISPIPTTPKNFTITNVTSTGMKLSWDAVSNATSYTVYKDGKSIYTGANNTYNVTGLTPYTLYQYKVKANNSLGSSETVSNSAMTLRDIYDDSTDISASCQDDTITRTFTLPNGIRPGTAGQFSINITNKLSKNLFVKIESIDKSGELFEGTTPAFLEFSTTSKIVSPGTSYEIPIKWTLPSKADSSYSNKTGTINVKMTTSCQG